MLRKALYYISHWEDWHWFAKYIPIAPVWVWHCLRSGSLWFFTPSNPSLTFGGFLGETKREMYEQLPPAVYPLSIYISHSQTFSEVEALFEKTTLRYPVAVKPDAGMMGFMFRKINNLDELNQYHSVMPCDYIIQKLIDLPLEVSVFYYRFPDQQSGKITGFLKKEFLEVIGDGRSTLRQLISNYSRVMFRQEEMIKKHESRLEDILSHGERYCLSYALNLSRGGKLVNIEDEKDDDLLSVFDKLSHYTGTFYYGRYDIKCKSVEDLKAGINYSILEYNGSGAEPHHVYGNGNTLLQAYKILLHHWNILYKISRINRQRGIRYWSYREGARFSKNAKEHFRILKQLDRKFEFTSLPIVKNKAA